MNLSAYHRDELLEAVASDLALRAGHNEIAGKVRVYWNFRMRSNAGVAYPAKLTIVLNPHLANAGFHEVNRTLRHELAHLIAYLRAKKRRIDPHGIEWKKACSDLGIPNEPRCHNLPLPKRKLIRRYFYECPNCKKIIRRVRRIRPGVKIACGDCCRKFNNGKFADKFQLVFVTQPDFSHKNSYDQGISAS
ncbi:MAG: SprT-like domain-containing protein [Chthoniobacterales bacterium]|nr:SprT-like domain-containing protein [Chthoniobacterales bacterium]